MTFLWSVSMLTAVSRPLFLAAPLFPAVYVNILVYVTMESTSLRLNALLVLVARPLAISNKNMAGLTWEVAAWARTSTSRCYLTSVSQNYEKTNPRTESAVHEYRNMN